MDSCWYGFKIFGWSFPRYPKEYQLLLEWQEWIIISQGAKKKKNQKEYNKKRGGVSRGGWASKQASRTGKVNWWDSFVCVIEQIGT